MTEQEAKTKWCDGPKPHNTGIPIEQENGTYRYVCSGSACMAWRWWPPVGEIVMQEERPEGDGWESRPGFETTEWYRTQPNDQGCCGLAGKT